MKSGSALPKNASTDKARIRNGIAAWKSASISTNCSTQPRKCAARKPSSVPKVAEMMVAPKATISEIRTETISRDRTSRPSSSVPSQCSVWKGGASLLRRS